MAEKENSVKHPQHDAQWAMLAFEHAYDPIFVHRRNPTGLSGQFVAVNGAACRRLGYTAEELLALSPQDIAVPKAVSKYPRIKETATEQGNVVFESVQLTKAGKKIPVENSAYLLDIDGGTMVITISRDISERKKSRDDLEKRVVERTVELEKAGEALQSASHQWQSTFDAIGDAVCILTPDFKILRCNKAMLDLTGKTYDQIVGHTCWKIVHGTSKPVDNCPVVRMKETLRRGTATYQLGDRWVSAAVDPILDINGNLIGSVHILSDITERKQVEEAVRKERDKAQQYLDVAGTVFVAINTKGEVTLINKKGCDLLGYKEYEIIGKNWFENYIPERIRAEIIPVSKKLLAGEIEPVEYYENPVVTKYGKERIVAWHNTIIKDDSGRVVGHLSSGEDVTERKQAEEAYHTLVDNTLQGLLIRQDGRIVFANRVVAEMSGYTVEELLGLSLEEIQGMVHSDDQDFVFKQAQDRLEGKPVPAQFEFRFVRKDGTARWVEQYASLIEYSGKPAAQATYIDITERKRAEEELEQTTQKLTSHLGNTPIGYIEWDLNFQVTEWNNAAIKIFGYTREEALGKHAAELMVPELARELVDKVWSDLISNRGGTHSINENFSKSGVELVCEWYNTTLTDRDGKVIGGASLVQDITERKRAEEALRYVGESLAMAQEAAGIGSWDWNIEDNTLSWSDETYRQFELKPQEIIPTYELFETFIHPDDREFCNREVQRALNGEKQYSIDARMVRADGTTWIMHSQGKFYKDNMGKIVRFLGTQQDITERKKAEEALVESKRYLTNAQTMAHIGHWKLDPITQQIEGSDELFRVFGLEREEVTLEAFAGVVHPDDREYDFYHIRRGMETGEPWDIEHRVVCKDGTEKYVNAIGEAIKDNTGKIIMLVGTVQDITERKKAEEEIRKLSNAVEQSIDGVAISDLELKLVFVNQAFAQIHGYTVEEMMGMKVDNLHSKEQQREFKRRIVQISKKGSWAGEIGHTRKDGSTFPTFTTATLLKDDQGNPTGVLALVRDITEQKKADEALRASEMKYENLVEQSNDGIIIIQSTLLKFVNSKMAEMTGYTHDELMDKPFMEFVAPGYRDVVINRYKQRMAGIYVPSE